jgi:hypothetical protein
VTRSMLRLSTANIQACIGQEAKIRSDLTNRSTNPGRNVWSPLITRRARPSGRPLSRKPQVASMYHDELGFLGSSQRVGAKNVVHPP